MFFQHMLKNALFCSFVVILTLFHRFLGLFALDPSSCILEVYCPIMVSKYFTEREASEKVGFTIEILQNPSKNT